MGRRETREENQDKHNNNTTAYCVKLSKFESLFAGCAVSCLCHEGVMLMVTYASDTGLSLGWSGWILGFRIALQRQC